MSLDLNIEVPRNGHYCQDWQLADNVGEPIDLTGHALEISVKAVAGQGADIASADIDIHAPTDGLFTVTLAGADFSAVDGATEIVRLAFDLKHTDDGGISRIYPRGQIHLMPGVS